MTIEELNNLRFNTPIYSNIDNTMWFYDCREGNNFKIFKELVHTEYVENVWRGRTYINTRWGQEPWKREGALTVSEQMMLEDFDLVYKIAKPDIKLVKKDKDLMAPYSIVKPNFHMMDLPF
jgi:hypothetical protein